MARLKYDWEEIQKAYEVGLPVDKIVRKYNVTKKTLQNKISEKKWEVSGSIKATLTEFGESIGKVSGIIEDNPDKAEIIAEEADELAKDLELIRNSAKFFLGKAVTKAKDPKATMDDIYKGSKVVTETGMNLGVISRHANSQVVVNNQNNNQVNATIELTEEEAKKKALELGVPLSALTSH